MTDLPNIPTLAFDLLQQTERGTSSNSPCDIQMDYSVKPEHSLTVQPAKRKARRDDGCDVPKKRAHSQNKDILVPLNQDPHPYAAQFHQYWKIKRQVRGNIKESIKVWRSLNSLFKKSNESNDYDSSFELYYCALVFSDSSSLEELKKLKDKAKEVTMSDNISSPEDPDLA